MSMTEHLHLVREKEPEHLGQVGKKGYHVLKFYCPHCDAWIYVIHLDLPPENPK